MSRPRVLSDGTTISVKTRRTIAGTYFHEVPSRKRAAGVLMRLNGPMYLVVREQLVPISHPDFAYASDDKTGATIALRFFADAAESCIRHAAEEGIAVQDCYGPA